MNRLAWVISFGFVLPFAMGQSTSPQDGTYTLDHPLWNASYMPTYRDQFVHGEGYRSYPGPLPKVLYALGRDTKGPAVDWEMLVNVNRDVPTWFGICNGWAASNLLYSEPGSIVVNGVKILPGDHKAFLTTIFKDLTAQYYGNSDPVFGGMTPDSFEEVLFRFVVDQEQSIIFDVALDDQVWNYPIKGFTRESEVNGEWTYVTITTLFPGLTQLNDSVGAFFAEEFVYEFRYRTATKTQYEWVGNSENDHPQTAWLPREPYLKGVPVVNANHYYTIDDYNQLLAKAAEEDHLNDLQEPNDTRESAFKISNELVLGSLLLADTDYYAIPAKAGEPIDFSFTVYDGRGVNFSVLDPNGSPVLTAPDTMQEDVQITAAFTGEYVVEITQKEDAFLDSFYQLVFPEDASSFVSETMEPGAAISAVNTREKELMIAGLDVENVEPYGSRSFLSGDVGEVRASDRVLWAETFQGQSGTVKHYFLDHQKVTDYVVPHITCRNGWKTTLEIRRQAKSPVSLSIHGQDGVVLATEELPFGDGLLLQQDIASLFSTETLEAAAWMDFHTTTKLKGFAIFTDKDGMPIRIDIASRPRFGDMLVFDLREGLKGGTGLAVVSTSASENEVKYRVEDGAGNEVVDGTLFMQQGQKWLTTIDALVDVPMQDDFTFFLHTQFPIEGVVVQVTPDSIYGHRILGEDIDYITETFVTLPEDRSDAGFIFANYNDRARHVLFEGFSADGELQGRFNIELGNPLASRESRRVSLQQILENGVGIKDLDAITHFRLTSVDPFYGMELSGMSSGPAPVVIPLMNVYEYP